MTSLTLELGRRRTWRNYTPGQWVKERVGAEVHMKHVPAKYEIKVRDDIARGLQETSDQWKRANELRQPEGDCIRMFRVSNVKKLPNEPDPPAGMPPMMRAMDHLATKLVDGLAKALKGK